MEVREVVPGWRHPFRTQLPALIRQFESDICAADAFGTSTRWICCTLRSEWVALPITRPRMRVEHRRCSLQSRDIVVSK